jgi:hypothetical protein
VKSQVRLAERQITQLKQEKLFLETEFETRASQQQLKAFNDVDFGYQAPPWANIWKASASWPLLASRVRPMRPIRSAWLRPMRSTLRCAQ